MVELDRFEGEFWLPEAPERKVHGDCIFKEDGRIELRLRGTFENPFNGFMLSGADSYDRILGASSSRYITLEGCRNTNGTTTTIGGVRPEPFVRKVMSVQRAYDGIELTGDEETRFFKAAIQVENLQLISGLNGFQERHLLNEGKTGIQGFELAVEVGTLGPEPFEHGTIAINDRYQLETPHPGERIVRQSHEIVLDFASPKTADDITQLATYLRDVVALATQRASGMISIHLFHEDAKTESPNGDVHIPIRYRWRQMKTSVDIDRTLKGFDPLFTISDLGGVGGLGRLVSVLARNDFANARIMSTIHQPPQFIEMKTMLRLFPLEAVFREWPGSDPDQVKDYKRQLTFLIQQAGDPMRNLLDQWTESWANAAKSARNLEGHSNPGKWGDQHQNLNLHAHVALWLYVMIMLRQADAPEAAFTRLSRSSKYQQHTHSLATIAWSTSHVEIDEATFRRLQAGTATVHVDRGRDEFQNLVAGDVICFHHGDERVSARLTGEIGRYLPAKLNGVEAQQDLGASHAEALTLANQINGARKLSVLPIRFLT
ncbi:hypothetical protein [Glycomyces sp. NPDC047010]|uniref:ApeA N-terminal domain 1-containing protein n=1 Tax=Glycomyces sp. NPDC047010 TaxID=3155023 RepID=UPI0033D51F8F